MADTLITRPESTSVYSWLKDDKHRIVYLCIPKNANSFLRAVFLANNFTDFDPENESALKYQERTGRNLQPRDVGRMMKDRRYKKIVVLRDPLSRLVSAYLDKVVKFELKRINQHWLGQLYAAMTDSLGRSIDCSNITFADFATHACMQPDAMRDSHWRSQSSFTGGYRFDFYGNVEAMETTLRLLRDNGLRTDIGPIKSAKRTQYSLSRPGGKPAWDARICELNAKGSYPGAQYFYSPDILLDVKKAYAKDMELFCNTQNIMFEYLLDKYDIRKNI